MEPDFYFIGTRGRREKSQRFSHGYHSAVGFENGKTPVFAIPDGSQYRKYQHIIFGSDLKSITPDVVAPLKRVLERTDADLTVIHVGDIDPQRKKQSMEELRPVIGPRMSDFQVVSSSEVVEGLQNAALDIRADLLVLVERKRNFFQRLFHRSVTREIGWKTRIPMLVLHD